MITVCSLSRLAETVERTGARRLVTLISAGTQVPRPATITAEDHLFLAFNDITAPAEGLTPPGSEHVAALVDFVGTWDRQAPLVIHCFAGISRSTAAAFISACALAPQANEGAIARSLRAAAPSATPQCAPGGACRRTSRTRGPHDRGGSRHRSGRRRVRGAALHPRCARAFPAHPDPGGLMLEIGLNAVIVSVADPQPQVLTIPMPDEGEHPGAAVRSLRPDPSPHVRDRPA